MLINLSNLRLVTATSFLLLCLPVQNNPLEGPIASAGENQPIYASPTGFKLDPPTVEVGPLRFLASADSEEDSSRPKTVRSDSGYVVKEFMRDKIGYTEKDHSLFGHPRKITYTPQDFSIPTFIVTAVPGSLNEAAGACERHHFPVLHMHTTGNMVLCSAQGERPSWPELVKLAQEPDVAEVTPNQEIAPASDLGQDKD